MAVMPPPVNPPVYREVRNISADKGSIGAMAMQLESGLGIDLTDLGT